MKKLALILLLFAFFSCKKKEVKPVEKQIKNYKFIAEYPYTGDTLIVKINGKKSYANLDCKTGDVISVYYKPYIDKSQDTVIAKKHIVVYTLEIGSSNKNTLFLYKGWQGFNKEFKIE